MTCDLNQIDAYVDGELSGADLAAVEAHLRECPACTAVALARMQLKRATHTVAHRFTPSPEFRARIASQASARPWHRVWFRSPVVLSAIAAVLLVVISLPLAERHFANQRALTELLDLHVATLASANPVDVVSTDRHTVKPWFQGKLPFTFNLPEFDNSPYKLLGGKLIYFDHNPGAQLLFSLRQHRLSVFIVQTTAPMLAAAHSERGFSTESWNAAGLRYTVIGDAAASDIHRLADLLRTAQSQ